jgi:hypothetical protein
MASKPAGNTATNGRDAFKDRQADGVKNYSDNNWGPFKPQQVSNKPYREQQARGEKGFGTFPKRWW